MIVRDHWAGKIYTVYLEDGRIFERTPPDPTYNIGKGFWREISSKTKGLEKELNDFLNESMQQ